MNLLEEEISLMFNKLESKGISKIIAFSGGSESGEYVQSIARESIDVMKEHNIAILTGGTTWGLPNAVTKYAQKLSISVIGVYPSRGKKHTSSHLDFALEVPPKYSESEWGDDSEVFAKLIHGVEIIGGGMGTMIEFAHIMKINETRIKYGTSPIYVAPVRTGERVFSDVLHHLPIKHEVKMACMPTLPFTEGKSAANYLLEKVGL